MGFEDIAYNLIKEYRASKNDKQKQIEIMKTLAKKAYLRFNFEWKSEIDSEIVSNQITRQRNILDHYSQLFLDIAVEIFDVLPDEAERMKNVATLMKKGASGDLTYSSNGITPIGDKCASDVIEYMNTYLN